MEITKALIITLQSDFFFIFFKDIFISNITKKYLNLITMYTLIYYISKQFKELY